jgi:hypothetical protein
MERDDMRSTLLAAATAFVIGGIATGAVLSHAQPAPVPVQQTDSQPPQSPPMPGWHQQMGPGAMGPGAMGPGAMRHGRFNPRAFALVYRQQDRNLAPGDVQKIAEAFLLWNGNHTWKVTNVSAMADGPIGFSLSTPEGSVIAKFTMDPHSGRIRRIG